MNWMEPNGRLCFRPPGLLPGNKCAMSLSWCEHIPQSGASAICRPSAYRQVTVTSHDGRNM